MEQSCCCSVNEVYLSLRFIFLCCFLSSGFRIWVSDLEIPECVFRSRVDKSGEQGGTGSGGQVHEYEVHLTVFGLLIECSEVAELKRNIWCPSSCQEPMK